jgi:hypothetical protein
MAEKSPCFFLFFAPYFFCHSGRSEESVLMSSAFSAFIDPPIKACRD